MKREERRVKYPMVIKKAQNKEKMQKFNKIKRLIDKAVKGEIFMFQEEVEYQERNTYLHRLNEKIQWYARYKDPTPFIAEIRNEEKVILTPLFDAYGRYDIFGTNGEKEGEVCIPLDDFLLMDDLF